MSAAAGMAMHVCMYVCMHAWSLFLSLLSTIQVSLASYVYIKQVFFIIFTIRPYMAGGTSTQGIV